VADAHQLLQSSLQRLSNNKGAMDASRAPSVTTKAAVVVAVVSSNATSMIVRMLDMTNNVSWFLLPNQ
jgi:hypothetical protein